MDESLSGGPFTLECALLVPFAPSISRPSSQMLERFRRRRLNPSRRKEVRRATGRRLCASAKYSLRERVSTLDSTYSAWSGQPDEQYVVGRSARGPSEWVRLSRLRVSSDADSGWWRRKVSAARLVYFVYVSKDPLFLRRSNSSSLLLQYTSCRSKRNCSFVLLPPMKEMGVALEPRAKTRASADVSRRLRAQTVALRPSSNLILSPVLLAPSSLCHFVAS